MSTDHPTQFRANREFPLPASTGEVMTYLASLPEDSELDISVIQGGSQRDPYPVKVIFSGKWER